MRTKCLVAKVFFKNNNPLINIFVFQYQQCLLEKIAIYDEQNYVQ